MLTRLGAAFSAAGEAWAASRTPKQLNLTNDEGWLDYAGGSSTAASGMTVSETTALNVTTVYACVGVLAGIQSSLPCHLVRESDDGTERAYDHPLYPILHDQANAEVDSGKWREQQAVGELLWGNGYSYIELDSKGNVAGIWGLTSDRVSVSRDTATRKLVYEVTNQTGPQSVLEPWQVVHISSLSYDGIVGKSRVGLHREAIGLAAVTERHGAEFFGQGARPGPVVTSPRRLTWKQAHNIEELIAKRRGAGNFSRPLVLGEGLSVAEYSMPHDDAEFLATRQVQVAEIAGRIFCVPLWMVGAREEALGTSLESEMIAFVTTNVAPRCMHWERAMQSKLLTPSELADGYRIKLDLRGLLRASYMTRITGYASAIQNGWMNRNEARRLEDMNEGPEELDEFLVQTGGAGLSVPARSPQQTGGPNEREREAMHGLYTATWGRILRRGRQDWSRVEGGRLGREDWRAELEAYASEQLSPVHITWEAAGGRPLLDLSPIESARGTGELESAAKDAATWSMGRTE